MTRKFLIVNNGMTELRGHYLETSVSVAEVAKSEGYDVTIAAHKNFSGALVSDGYTIIPAFHVDHWGVNAVLPEDLSVDRATRTGVSSLVQKGLQFPSNLLVRLGVLTPKVFRERQFLREMTRELVLSEVFRRDLARLVKELSLSSLDHVYLPTSHGREALAVHQLLKEIGEESAPTFHLEFRHTVLTEKEMKSTGYLKNEYVYSRIHETFYRQVGQLNKKMGYYTDTLELAKDYESICDVPFKVLPIPFRSHMIPPRKEIPEAPVTILAIGDPREEKGFLLLPDLVEKLYASHLLSKKARCVFQSVGKANACRKLIRAETDLKQYETQYVDFFGNGGFVSPEDYYRILQESDIVLCHYDDKIYQSRSSGVLTEAIIAGKPVVVPASGWMSRQTQAREQFHGDSDSLTTAVVKIIDNIDHYRSLAEIERQRWVVQHSPRRLLEMLIS